MLVWKKKNSILKRHMSNVRSFSWKTQMFACCLTESFEQVKSSFPHVKTLYVFPRLGNAGGLLRLYSAPLGGWQEAHGEHARLLLWHQRALAAATVPGGHGPHRWETNNATLHFRSISVPLLFSECYPPTSFQSSVWHLSYTFALTLLCKYNFQVIRHSQIPWRTPHTVISARMLWPFNPSNSDTSV